MKTFIVFIFVGILVWLSWSFCWWYTDRVIDQLSIEYDED